MPQEEGTEDFASDNLLAHDIQKELEAKFDELFGAFEDPNNN